MTNRRSIASSAQAVEVSLMAVLAFVRTLELVAGNKVLAPTETKKNRPIGFAPWKEK